MPWMLFDTAIGACGLAWSDAGVTRMLLPDASPKATRSRLLERIEDKEEASNERSTPPWIRQAVALVTKHIEGRPQDLARVPLDLTGISPFHVKVYRALQTIPAGRTTSYGALARAAGSEGASRAVGRAMATNPYPLFVPCHRVVGAAGKPGGFSAYGGLITKEHLLSIEGGTLRTLTKTGAQPSLFAGTAPKLPYDPIAAVGALSAADPQLAKLIARVGPLTLRLKETEGTFAALAESIVYQQLNGKAAATIFARVRQLFPGGTLEPRRLLTIREDSLREAGLSRNKLASIRDLAERTIAGEIPTLAELAGLDDDDIVAKLTRVRGIGRWTVEMLLIFRLGRSDVLPLADYGIQKGFALTFPRLAASEGALERRGERWRPFRSVASWYLWRATELAR